MSWTATDGIILTAGLMSIFFITSIKFSLSINNFFISPPSPRTWLRLLISPICARFAFSPNLAEWRADVWGNNLEKFLAGLGCIGVMYWPFMLMTRVLVLSNKLRITLGCSGPSQWWPCSKCRDNLKSNGEQPLELIKALSTFFHWLRSQKWNVDNTR